MQTIQSQGLIISSTKETPILIKSTCNNGTNLVDPLLGQDGQSSADIIELREMH